MFDQKNFDIVHEEMEPEPFQICVLMPYLKQGVLHPDKGINRVLAEYNEKGYKLITVASAGPHNLGQFLFFEKMHLEVNPEG